MPGVKTVDEYIAGLSPAQAEVVAELRRLVREAAPEASEVVKWSQPVYERRGPVCYIKAFARFTNFGFWRGAELDDPEGVLTGDGDRMKHVRLDSAGEIRAELLQPLIRAAVRLNEQRGDPTGRS